MSREDTALVCGIYGLDIFWHLFCFPTPTLGKAGWSRQFLLQPGSWPLLPMQLLPADTSVWGRLADQAGGRMWDTLSHHRYFWPSYNFSAMKQRQQSCEQSWAVVSSEWQCFTSCHCSPQSTRQWRSPLPCHPGVWGCDVFTLLQPGQECSTDRDLGQRDHI